jgi:integrase/recombinase XerD
MSQPQEHAEIPLPTAVRLLTPAPIERLVVVDALSGRDGSNRSRAGHRQITADTDRDALLAWLARYTDSPNTFANCRKEAERLFLWCLAELGKPLSSLTHEDLLLYRRFLSDPQPVDRWVMPTGRKLPRIHPGWRPFAGPLSPASQRQAMVTLNSMLSWLVQAGYLAGNPLALSRQRRSNAAPRVVRFLEDDLWAQVKTSINAMPIVTSREQATQARVRWLFSMLYLCGLRISEVVGNTMGGFFCRTDKGGVPRWWLEVIGKGGKTRLVPATNELMVELSRYRRALGLSMLPQEHESAPLLLPVWWAAPVDSRLPIDWPQPMTRAAVHGIVKGVFEATAESLLTKGTEFEARAERVRAASAHWLRHTRGSHLADDIDLRHVRDTLGHASISTTSIYLHAEDDQRHQAISTSHRLGWDASPTLVQPK